MWRITLKIFSTKNNKELIKEFTIDKKNYVVGSTKA